MIALYRVSKYGWQWERGIPGFKNWYKCKGVATLSILISEDHPLVRIGAQHQLRGRLPLPVETCSKSEIERRLRELQPRVLIVGVSESEDFKRAAARYRALSHCTRIVVIPPIESSLPHRYGGAAASISRRALPERLTEVVRGVLRGRPARRPHYRSRLSC